MNNEKILVLPPSKDYTPEQALLSALHMNDLSDVLIIGYHSDGELFIRSSKMTRAEAVYLAMGAIDWAKHAGEV